MRYLFLLFLLMPILEMLLLFEVSGHIGALSTVGLVMLTAVIGINILKQQGLSTFSRANQRMNSGQLPATEMIEGLFLAVGGAFLLTPGFITDTLGFFFLIGPSRRFLANALITSGKISMFKSKSGFQSRAFYDSRTEGRSSSSNEENGVYEAEFTREQPPKSRIEPTDLDKKP